MFGFIKEKESLKEKYKRLLIEKRIEAIKLGNYKLDIRAGRSGFNIKILDETIHISYNSWSEYPYDNYTSLIGYEIIINGVLNSIHLGGWGSEESIFLLSNIEKHQKADIQIIKDKYRLEQNTLIEIEKKFEDEEYLRKINKLLKIKPLDKDLKRIFNIANDIEYKRKEVLEVQELYFKKIKELDILRNNLNK